MKSRLATILALLAAGQAAIADLVFEQTLLEFHVGAEETKVTADFAFRNEGDKIAHIVKSESGCTCLNVGVSGGKFEFAPGEGGVVRAIFDLRNYTGITERHVIVWHGTDKNHPASTQLSVRAHIPVLVSIEPKNLTWETDSPAEPKIFEILMDPAQKTRILNLTGTSANFSLELKTMADGSRYQIVVTPESTATPGIGMVRIETDSDNERFKVLQAFTVIRNTPPGP